MGRLSTSKKSCCGTKSKRWYAHSLTLWGSIPLSHRAPWDFLNPYSWNIWNHEMLFTFPDTTLPKPFFFCWQWLCFIAFITFLPKLKFSRKLTIQYGFCFPWILFALTSSVGMVLEPHFMESRMFKPQFIESKQGYQGFYSTLLPSKKIGCSTKSISSNDWLDNWHTSKKLCVYMPSPDSYSS